MSTELSYPSHKTTKGLFIVVEGNIGSGKTTLCNTIHRLRSGSGPCSIMPEPVDKPSFRKLLGLFYTDPKRWAFAFQMHALKERFNQHTLASELVNNHMSVVQDRSIYADGCFGITAHELGNMTGEEWDIYAEMFASLKRFLRYPDVVVYLRVMPEICKERMDRRKRPEEEGVPLDYLKKIHDQHEKFIEEMSRYTRVLMVDTSPISDEQVAEVNAAIEKVAAEERRFMRDFRKL